MGTIDTRQLFDLGHKLRTQKVQVMDAQMPNRETLRNLATQGLLSKEEVAELEKLYPSRTRKKKGE